MHYNCLYNCKDFVKKYLDPEKELKILEVGSLILPRSDGTPSGSFRRYFNNLKWDYVGLDIESGLGVDIVSDDLYKYPFNDNSFDVIISGNTMEHVEDIYKWIKELVRITKDLIWISVPNICKEHRHPVDCWRVFPDGMRFLLNEIAGLEVLLAETSKRGRREDTIGIGKKKL